MKKEWNLIQIGCDGGRVYYGEDFKLRMIHSHFIFLDGMSSIAQNESLYAQINQFDIEETVHVAFTIFINI